jgi:hypothetical protein
MQDELDRCDTIIRRRNGRVVAAVPQFGLFAEADTIKAALEALEVKKQRVAADLVEFAGMQTGGSGAEGNSIRWREIKQFALKAAIVAGLGMAVLMFCAIQAKHLVDSTIYSVQARVDRYITAGGGNLWPRIERKLEEMADPSNALPDDKKQKVLGEIRTIVGRLQPFVAEAAGILPSKPDSAQAGK